MAPRWCTLNEWPSDPGSTAAGAADGEEWLVHPAGLPLYPPWPSGTAEAAEEGRAVPHGPGGRSPSAIAGDQSRPRYYRNRVRSICSMILAIFAVCVLEHVFVPSSRQWHFRQPRYRGGTYANYKEWGRLHAGVLVAGSGRSRAFCPQSPRHRFIADPSGITWD